MQSRSLYKLFLIAEKDNQNTLLFSIIHIVPNFFKLFRNKNPKFILTQGQYDILLALTIYTFRFLEPNLIDQFKPFFFLPKIKTKMVKESGKIL